VPAAKIIQFTKGVSAGRANATLGQPFCQDESFDLCAVEHFRPGGDLN
jgi:hypothetical protein